MLNKQNTNGPTSYDKFALFLADEKAAEIKKSKTVGMAYLRQGQQMYTLRLWAHLSERYYMLATRDDPSKFLIMTREPSHSEYSKNKFFWNIVGNACSMPDDGVIELNFDLLSKPIYLSYFPEASSKGNRLKSPEEIFKEDAA